jgi:hypothetical protein
MPFESNQLISSEASNMPAHPEQSAGCPDDLVPGCSPQPDLAMQLADFPAAPADFSAHADAAAFAAAAADDPFHSDWPHW